MTKKELEKALKAEKKLYQRAEEEWSKEMTTLQSRLFVVEAEQRALEMKVSEEKEYHQRMENDWVGEATKRRYEAVEAIRDSDAMKEQVKRVKGLEELFAASQGRVEELAEQVEHGNRDLGGSYRRIETLEWAFKQVVSQGKCDDRL